MPCARTDLSNYWRGEAERKAAVLANIEESLAKALHAVGEQRSAKQGLTEAVADLVGRYTTAEAALAHTQRELVRATRAMDYAYSELERVLQVKASHGFPWLPMPSHAFPCLLMPSHTSACLLHVSSMQTAEARVKQVRDTERQHKAELVKQALASLNHLKNHLTSGARSSKLSPPRAPSRAEPRLLWTSLICSVCPLQRASPLVRSLASAIPAVLCRGPHRAVSPLLLLPLPCPRISLSDKAFRAPSTLAAGRRSPG